MIKYKLDEDESQIRNYTEVLFSVCPIYEYNQQATNMALRLLITLSYNFTPLMSKI